MVERRSLSMSKNNILSERLLASISHSIDAIKKDKKEIALQLLTDIENEMQVIIEMIDIEDRCVPL